MNSLVCKLLSSKKSNEWKKREREEGESDGEFVFPSPLALSLAPLSFILSMCYLGTLAQPAFSEGSRQLAFDVGDRAYLEYRTDNTANIPRRASIKVYVRPGEELNLGSSAVGLGQGRIDYTRPDGSQGSCGTQGRINNINEEVAGSLPNTGGYDPCRITIEPNQEGIWEIFFVSPNPDNRTDPPPRGVREAWTQNDNVYWLAAWDVTVRSAPGGTEIPGRAYANYLPLNLGSNGRSLEARTIILTRDGYQYQVDPRGLDPFGFLFFANNKGFTSGGNPLYQSVEAPAGQPLPVQSPTEDRNDINTPDVTHKIFFNPVSTDLPPTARIAGGSTWLLGQPVSPPVATNFRFVGEEGTENQAGTNPLTGTFSFNAPSPGPYSIVLDINGDGNFGNENDRIFFGQATAGENRVTWDGLDGRGNKVPAGEQRYRAAIVLYAGEVHFPLIDAENNPRGGVIQRLTPLAGGGGNGSIFDPFSVYYDDRVIGQTPRPDKAESPPNPLFAFGISSQNGAHAYSTNGQPAFNRGFGDERGIDTWVFTPSAPTFLSSPITLKEADLAIQKDHEPANPVAGGQVTYVITVRNNGPSDLNTDGQSNAIDAQVTDTIPDALTNVTWTCEASQGSTCRTPNGQGNNIDTRVNLRNGGTATFRVTGTLNSNIQAGTTVRNDRAIVRRPNDVTDPNDVRREGINNNIDDDVFTVGTGNADVRIEKVREPNSDVTPGSEIRYTIRVIAEGSTPSNNVRVEDATPQGLEFVRNEGDCTSAFPCNFGNLQSGQTRTFTSIFRVPAGYNGPSPILNVATVASDNDSNPNNNRAEVRTNVTAPPTANVRIEKTGPGNIAAGSEITYQIRVTAEGGSASTGVQLSDQTPQGLNFVRVEGSGCTTLPCNLGDIPNGESRTVNATFSVPANYNGPNPIVNTATVSSGNDSNPNDNSATVNTTPSTQPPPPGANVRVEKTGPDNVTPGNNITYQIRVIAEGNTASTGVQLSDQTPQGLTLVGVEGSGCTSFPCNLGDIANGQDRTVSVTFSVPTGYNGPNPIANTATVTSGNDSNPNDNNASKTTTVSTPTNADVIATKTGPSTVDPGGSITYTITVRNNGPAAANNVIIRDTLPPGVTFNNASDGGTFANGVVSFPAIPSLAPNTSVNRTITVTAPASGDPLLNVVASTSDTPDPDPNNNNGSQPPARVITTITQTPTNADVVATKTGPATVAPGGSITYNITVTNNGPNPAANVVIRDTLPAGVTFNSASDGGTEANGVVSFPPIPSLASGTSVTRTIIVTAPASGGPLQNVVSSTSDTPDPTPANNDGSQPPARVTTAITQTPGNADVAAVKTGPSTVDPGATITYTITVTNNGPNPAANVVIRDTLPAGVTFNSASDGGTEANGVVSFPPIPSLASGASVNRTITVTAPASGGPLQNVVSSTSDTPDPDPNNNNGSQPPARVTTTLTQVPANADVVATKTGPSTVAPNGTITYTITIRNNGPAPANNVVVRDTLPGAVTFNSASDGGTAADGVVTFPPIPTLAANTSVTRTIIVTAPASGDPLLNVVSSTSDTPDPTPNNNDGSQPPARVITTITQTPTNADVVATKTGPATVAGGGSITYNITVTNNGPNPAANVVIRDTLPAGVTFNSASDGGTEANGVVSFPPIPSLAPGASLTRTVTVTAPASGGPLQNVVSSTSDTPDPTPANNDGSQPPARVTTAITQTPANNADVVATKTGPATVAPNGSITYTITLRNNGPTPAANVVVRDTLPGAVTFNSASDGGTAANGVVSFPPIPSLAPGASVTRTIIVTAPASGDPLVNVVSSTSDTPDSDLNNNNGTQPPARVTTTITQAPTPADVVTTKTGPGTVTGGGTITYTITTTNNGPNPAANVVIRDALPQGVTFNSASDGGTVANGVVTFPPIPSLAPNTSVTRTITVTAPASGSPLLNVASSTADTPDPTPANNNGTQPPAQVTTTITPAVTDVQVTESGPTAPVPVGTNITFTSVVTNNGPTVANQVTFTNPLPPNVTFVSATPSLGTCAFNNGTVTCNLGDLTPGQSVTIPIVVTPTAPGNINNPVSVSAANDSNPNNNNATAPAQVIVPQTDIEVIQTGPTEPLPVGNNVTFNISVTNKGPVTGTAVTLTNPLPEGTTLVSATPTQGTCTPSGNLINCNLGDLNPGQTVNIPVVVNTTRPGTITNPATIASPNDSNPANNQATAVAQIVAREPRIRVVKRITSVIRNGSTSVFGNFVDDPADQNDNAPGWSQFSPVGVTAIGASESLRSGDTVEYTIYFLSDGNIPAQNVNICDAIPANTTFIPESFVPGSGIQLNRAGTINSLTNAQDDDAGRFFSPLAPLPPGNPCSEQSNANGTVLFNLNSVPNAPGSNFGFVRFRVTID